MDKLAAMHAFRRVIELGSFRAAARDLGRSNAAVSKQIGDLEAQLGATLIARTTRRLAPTEVGQAYYERCARILDDLTEAETAVASLLSAPRGRLRVNAPMSFGLLHLSPSLPAYMQRCPDACRSRDERSRGRSFGRGLRRRRAGADKSSRLLVDRAAACAGAAAPVRRAGLPGAARSSPAARGPRSAPLPDIQLVHLTR